MFKAEDLSIICCPICKNDLRLLNNTKLECTSCKADFPITNDIPRLLYLGNEGLSYNKTWDYEWFVLDGGKGYNFKLLDPNDPAYRTHNVFKYNEYNGEAFKDLKGGIAVDIGCGTGPYSIKLFEKGAKRIYAIDLTRAVDVGKKIYEQRYPGLLDKIVFIQGNARFLPIKSDSIDVGMALASLHHSGDLKKCIEELTRVVKTGKRFFVWIYAKPLLPLSDSSRNLRGLIKIASFMYTFFQIELVYNITKRMPNTLRVLILKFFASDLFYFISYLPIIGRIIRLLTIPAVPENKDKGFRLLNLYDSYSPTFSEASDESDVIRWSKKFNFEVLDFSPWRLGFLGVKK